jgi:hypothetical protein
LIGIPQGIRQFRDLHWRDLLEFHRPRWRELAPGRAARIALGVAAPLLIGLATGHLEAGIFAALGAGPLPPLRQLQIALTEEGQSGPSVVLVTDALVDAVGSLGALLNATGSGAPSADFGGRGHRERVIRTAREE